MQNINQLSGYTDSFMLTEQQKSSAVHTLLDCFHSKPAIPSIIDVDDLKEHGNYHWSQVTIYWNVITSSDFILFQEQSDEYVGFSGLKRARNAVLVFLCRGFALLRNVSAWNLIEITKVFLFFLYKLI